MAYGEYIFQQLLLTDFVQHKLAQILLALVVNIINMHIVSGLCMLMTINAHIDFFLHIFISIIAALKINLIYSFFARYTPEFILLTQYLINNYSFENYRYWKRNIVLCACVYICIILWHVQITSKLLFVYIIQYGITFIIVDQFEQNNIQRWIYDWKNLPKISQNREAALLIESYMSPKEHILRKPIRESIIIDQRAR